MKKKILASLLALGVTSVFATPGPYMSLEAGTSTINGTDFDVGYGPAGRIAAGYLFGDQHFNAGFEFGVTGYNNMNAMYDIPVYSYEDDNYYDVQNKFSMSGHNVDFLAVGKYTFDNHFLVLGKIGLSYVTLKVNDDATVTDEYGDQIDGQGNAISTNWRGTAALGVGYQFTPQVAATLTVSGTSLGDGDARNNDGSLIASMLGLTYSFS